ncbi:MAG: outer membrane beta-barrel protein [Chitinophagales bacterium]|nr:outer membrane beta-barrel protein [Bacteroidota bacterium]MCB9256166.1 outer membrane beta-barrel protein [Chitinophagales bacterium]
MKKIWIYLAFFLPMLSIAQTENSKDKQLFVAYLAAGLNTSQIGGDLMAGYRRVGGNLGVGSYIMYKPFLSNSIEISYSMKGSQSNFSNKDPLAFSKFIFDYVEIPVMLNYHDKQVAIFSAGFTLGRLIRYKLTTGASELPADPVKWEIGLGAGATFLIKKRFGINLKVNYSMNNIWGKPFERETVSQTGAPVVYRSKARKGGWYHNTVSLRFIYLLVKKDEK